MAAMFGDYDTAVLLLEAGADVESTNALGDRPLQSAATVGQERLVALLLAGGAEVFNCSTAIVEQATVSFPPG